MKRFRAAHGIPAKLAPRGLQQALVQSEELRDALEASRRESDLARREVTMLAAANGRLRELAIQRDLDVARARHLAHHDELTGLPNRILLLDRLDQALARAQRQQKHLALLFLDLDRFKDVNDRLGHVAGDKLLKRVAERLQSSIRGGDTACRYGGDEFVILLTEIEDARHAREVAEKLRARLSKPCVVDDQMIAVTASIGVAVYPVDGVDQYDLIKRADFAMYLAKPREDPAPARIRRVSAR